MSRVSLRWFYRVTLVVEYLGWVDLDLGSSPGWWAAAVATYCPSRMVEHTKSKSTKTLCQTTRVTLYSASQFGVCDLYIQSIPKKIYKFSA